VIAPARAVRGRIQVPGDKSISHRYAILSALADGRSTIANYALGADCQSTLACLAALGVAIERPDGPGGVVAVTGRGLGGFTPPAAPLDCGNSGTTMRLMTGVLAAHPFPSTLFGDASLSRRPMRRVMAPLTEMGARFEAAPGDRPPVTVHGAHLRPFTTGRDPERAGRARCCWRGCRPRATSVTEPAQTRDHTERAL
jgi:3-phosphoshikimate 1-carboxyvinyltransferase